MFDRIKGFYDKRLWTKSQVHDAVEKGVLTAAQYEEITGEPYAA